MKSAQVSPRVGARSHPDEGWSVRSLREPRYSQSLERGLAILGCFKAEHPVLGIADLADSVGMSRSTVHRYVSTLVALGFLEQDASRRYRLGLRVADLGMSALNSTGLREHSRSYLASLRQRSGYTVSLAVLDGPEILYVDRACSFRRGQHEMNLNLRVGSRLPAYCTSLGKVLLASLSDAERHELMVQMTLAKRGPHTITSRKALRAELENVSGGGFAVNEEELAAGLVSIAVPIRAKNREVVAAINMAAHTSTIQLDGLVDQLLPDLFATADQISARLGFQRDGDLTR